MLWWKKRVWSGGCRHPPYQFQLIRERETEEFIEGASAYFFVGNLPPGAPNWRQCWSDDILPHSVFFSIWTPCSYQWACWVSASLPLTSRRLPSALTWRPRCCTLCGHSWPASSALWLVSTLVPSPSSMWVISTLTLSDWRKGQMALPLPPKRSGPQAERLLHRQRC